MEKMGKNLAGLIENVSQIRKTYGQIDPEPQPLKRDTAEPPHVCLFNSREQRDVWLFCMNYKIDLNTWANNFKELNEKEPRERIFVMPKTVSLDNRGNIPIDIFDARNKGRVSCQFCFRLGIAYIIRGPLLFNGIPGKLVATKCWCQR